MGHFKRSLTAVGLLLAIGGVAWVGSSLAKEPSKKPQTEGEEMGHHEEGRKNRLAGESSPYLLLHQYNPVDWYPWGEEALEKARREDKPIFLSVGYSTCYWCHVMERESFTNPEIAALLNEGFVSIKVDREERPDLDEIYMTATQVLTRHGGWPNSVFLTPELVPFFAGTYFPPEDRQGRPGFGTVLRSLENAWKNRRGEVEKSATQIADVMRRYLEERAEPTAAPPGPEVANRSLELLAKRFDETWGGFGSAPKFPTPSNLFLPLELAEENTQAGEMLAASLDHMARGGIYDQLAGGFHRYSTDRQWLVPHFEKMLYDNGFLLELYAREYQRTSNPEAGRIVRETAVFLEREMTSPEGALWSAIDAETDGHEGAYYVWSREELTEILGDDDAAFLAAIYGFDGEANFEGESYVLHLPESLDDQARRLKMSREKLLKRLETLKGKILAARWQRDRPLTDDKVLTNWNGIAITGLATAGRVLREPTFTRQAEKAASFVLREMRKGSVLQHSWRGGSAKIDAYLSDYAFLVRGLLALHETTGKNSWLVAAKELTEEQIRRLRDTGGGYFVAAEQPDLLFRSKDVLDGAMPSPNAVAVLNLLDLAERTGEVRWSREAEASLKAFGGMLEATPEGLRMMSVAAYRLGAKPDPKASSVASGKAPARPKNPLFAEAESAVAVAAEVGPEQQGWRVFRLKVEVASGWHINANPASQEFLIPTEVKASGTQLRALSYPVGSTLEAAYADSEIRVYEGMVEVRGELATSPGEGEAKLLFTYQACDEDRCLPPVTKELPL